MQLENVTATTNTVISVPKFHELNAYRASTVYDVINEEPELHNHLLGRKKFNKIGAIASAGEIVLLSLLPRVKEHLFAIDHTAPSLGIAYLKTLILHKYGAEEYYRVFHDGTWEDCQKLIDGVLNLFPEELSKIIETRPSSHGYLVTRKITDLLRRDMHHYYRRELHYGGKNMLVRAAKNTDKITFLHGDLMDLRHYGPLDLLYISNAQEHTDRMSKQPSFKDLATLLNMGGHILVTSSYTTVTRLPTDQFKQVAHIRAFRTSWYYFLFQRIA